VRGRLCHHRRNSDRDRVGQAGGNRHFDEIAVVL